MKNFAYQIILVVLLGIVHTTLAEFFTAMAEMEKLLQTEEEIVKTLESYLKKEEERLEKVKWLSKQYATLQSAANEDVDQFLSNPVNAYLLVKRLTSDWEVTNNLINNEESKDMVTNVTSQMLNFPSSEDLSGAAQALIRLQYMYLLNATAIADGEIKGTPQSAKLTAGDCYELGLTAFHSTDYNQSIVWLEEALRRTEQEDIQTANKTELMEYIAYAYYAIDDHAAAIKYTEGILTLTSNHNRAHNNLKFYQNEQENAKKMKVDLKEEKDVVIDYEKEGLWDPKIIQSYEKLCRGEILKTPKEQSTLHCYYSNNNKSYLFLQPVKIEVLNWDPRIVIFHDVISEKEADMLKAMSIPKLERATVSGGETGKNEFAHYRISKSCWLNGNDDPLVARINKRIEYFTGLSSATAEELHVINYGIGGYYEPHVDHSKPGVKNSFLPESRNRLATWIFYLSHVRAGGSTVFPQIGVEVKPIKGAAAFWHNLRRSGDGDGNTMHAACPVLSGSKWVANKWIHEGLNEFNRPCALDRTE